MTPTLPVEILCLILEEVTQKGDLCSAARSSALLQVEAERILYRSINIESHVKFLIATKSIICHPRRHQVVETLHIRHMPRSFRKSSISRLIARLLRVTTHLRTLKIRSIPGWALYRATHPFLQSLEYSSLWFREHDLQREYGYPLFVKYLERHPSITTLTLDRSIEMLFNVPPLLEDDLTLHRPLLPLLHTLNLSQGSSHYWVKDRQLKGCCLTSSARNATEQLIQTMPYLLAMGQTLVVLDLSRYSVRWLAIPELQGIEKITSSLPRLRYLGLPDAAFESLQDRQLWGDNLVRCIRTHLMLLVIFKIDTFLTKPIIDDLLTIRECLKWIITTATALSLDVVAHTRDKAEQRAKDDMELQRALSGLGIPRALMLSLSTFI